MATEAYHDRQHAISCILIVGNKCDTARAAQHRRTLSSIWRPAFDEVEHAFVLHTCRHKRRQKHRHQQNSHAQGTEAKYDALINVWDHHYKQAQANVSTQAEREYGHREDIPYESRVLSFFNTLPMYMSLWLFTATWFFSEISCLSSRTES